MRNPTLCSHTRHVDARDSINRNGHQYVGAAFALMMALYGLLMPQDSSAQISPGDLAKVHESLEGILNCTSCHKLGKGPSAEKCLECHTEVASLLDAAHGYHSRVVSDEGQLCFNCHSDHGGRDMDLIHWPEGQDSFDHALAGFDLKGKHKQAKCRQCHLADFVKGEFVSQFPDVNLARTFFGLDSACLSCHHDEHRDQLGQACLTCHTQQAWKPAKNFSHDKAKFKLLGKHKEAKCEKCHPVQNLPVVRGPGGAADVSFAKFTGINHKDCIACHKDPHDGRFAGTCKNCHNPTEWIDVKPGSFDHSQTKFPLKGLHTKVECRKCHTGGSKLKSKSFERCSDCHKDVHHDQFAKRNGGACEGCHSVDGFTPAMFTTEDHQDTRFPLQGAHLAQPCIRCHELTGQTRTKSKSKQYRKFHFTDVSCVSCHSKDPHLGQFTKSGPSRTCDHCHTQAEWSELLFDHKSDATFRLDGAHELLQCGQCHKTSKKLNGAIRYRPIQHECQSCHSPERLRTFKKTG